MNIKLNRLKDDSKATIGTLSIDGIFECFTLEDAHNEPKIYGKTRIPRGVYEVWLRNEGGMNERYSDKYNNHVGMLWLQNVENFEWVYIHVGNTEDDTDGCILVGQGCISRKDNMSIQGSMFAYADVYKKVSQAILGGEYVAIEVN